MAKSYSQRPSELFGAEHPLLAWDFDQAVSMFGGYVESKLHETDSKGKPRHSLKALLHIYDTFKASDIEGLPGVKLVKHGT